MRDEYAPLTLPLQVPSPFCLVSVARQSVALVPLHILVFLSLLSRVSQQQYLDSGLHAYVSNWAERRSQSLSCAVHDPAGNKTSEESAQVHYSIIAKKRNECEAFVEYVISVTTKALPDS